MSAIRAYQRTLASPARVSGVGVHTGVSARVAVLPAANGAGLSFRRVDLLKRGFDEPSATIAARPDRVSGVALGTRLENSAGASVATVEHLMAALALCEVDNAIIDIDGPEAPILDGSARDYMAAFERAGFRDQGLRRSLFLSDRLEVRDGDRFVRYEPGHAASLDVSIEFDETAIGRQSVSVDMGGPQATWRTLADARTFCRLSEIEGLRRAGLCLGGALDNAIVVDGGQVLNPEGLRDRREFAFHKALDLVGDLYLLGAPWRGAIKAHKPGHDLNNRFARAFATALSEAAEHIPFDAAYA